MVQYIKECVDSVLAQDYPNVEHIIHDGNSTDGTKEILEQYAKRYPGKIKLVSEPDNGQTDGLNKALQRVHGDIFLVLNGDDALLSNACSWAVKNMDEHPNTAVIYGDVHQMDRESRVLETYIPPHPFSFEELLCVELTLPAQASFIRSAHFREVGFYTDSSLDTSPDFEMFTRIGLQFPIQYIPGVVCKYRRDHVATQNGKPRSIERKRRSKKLIMDRIFDNPKTSLSIRKLRGRAHAGLNIWAAAAAWREKEKWVAWKCLLSGMGRYILMGQFTRAIRVIIRLVEKLRREKRTTHPFKMS